ncbi:MAG: D-2-hydroxyacid dehydrogenase [Halioglobus sp.]
MRLSTALATLSLMLVGAGLPHLAVAQPSEQATAIIEELGLRQADKPIADNPNWQPKRVLVTFPARLTTPLPGLEEQFRAAAGDMEIVFDKSGSFVPAAELLEGTDAVVGVCAPPTLQAAGPQLLWIHNYFVGMDRCVGMSDTQRETMVFTNNKRLSGPAIAEHTIAMMMSIARGLPAYSRAQMKSEWDNSLSTAIGFGEIKGKTMLVVGLGGIGTEIAWRAHGLGMRIIATRNSSRTGPDYVDYVGLADELNKLAGEADVIVNALPLTTKTTGVFNQSFFDAAKPGAMFLSVGRGQSTVTNDLIAALESGQIYGAGLDVTDPEPLPADSPLWQMPRVVITPHRSAAGVDSLRRMATIAVENLRRYANGEPMLNIVNINAGY